MCVIIYKPKGVIADKELLELRYKSNSDSWGVCVKAPSDGLVVTRNSKNFDFIFNDNLDYLIHFRTATSGTEKDCGMQPIILDNGSAFFLNGNLTGYFGKKEPDTVLYAKEYLNKLPANFLENEEIVNKITEDAMASNSKMAFMDKNGKIYLINENEGVWEKGMWFSNPRLGDYAGFGFSGLYPYKEGEKRNILKK